MKNAVRPIVKFNGGRGALLCNQCRVIIKEDLTAEELRAQTPLLYCTQYPACSKRKYEKHRYAVGDGDAPTYE